MALSFQSVLTYTVADENGFALDVPTQFMVYGVYFLCLGIIFAVVVSVTVIRYFCSDDFLNVRHETDICRESVSNHEDNVLTRI